MKRQLDILLAATMVIFGMLALACAQSGGFEFWGPLSRILTPNNDGRNDYAIFCFDNPSDSEVSGKIFSLLGGFVADISPRATLNAPPLGSAGQLVACPAGTGWPQYSYWDGKAGGAVVRSGVYLYQVKAEGLTFKGTLLVVK